MTMGDRIKQLRLSKGMTQEELGQKIGVQKAAIYKYESGLVVNLKRNIIEKLSNVLEVSPSYLMGLQDNDLDGQNSQKEKPAENDRLTERDRKDIAKDLERLRQDLESADTLMFDGDPMTDEARESILAAMKLGLEAAKIKNKEKYTPKKYKKD